MDPTEAIREEKQTDLLDGVAKCDHAESCGSGLSTPYRRHTRRETQTFWTV